MTASGTYLPYLLAWRHKKGWSHRQLSQHAVYSNAHGKESHVSPGTLMRLEKQLQPANDITISRIAHGLDITREQLLSSPDGESGQHDQ